MCLCMLRPAGYFRDIPCPFDQAAPGGCLRPHCQYKHSRGDWREPRPLVVAAATTAACPSLVSSTRRTLELERINKEIEAVKTEMEENQKKLVQYKQEAKNDENINIGTNLIDINGNHPCCADEQHIGDSKGSHNATSSSSRKVLHSVSSEKYVVDHRCPATDLEYDPILNYSADLLNSFTKKEAENKLKPKRFKISGHENGGSSKCKRSRTASPVRLEINLQESDDDTLVIDVPPLKPMSKKPRIKKNTDWNRREKECHLVHEENPPNNNLLKESMKVIETSKIEKNIASGPNDSNDLNKTVAVQKQQNMPLMQNIYLSAVTEMNTFNESDVNLDNTKYSSIPKMSNICLAQKDKGQLVHEENPPNNNSLNESIKVIETSKIEKNIASGPNDNDLNKTVAVQKQQNMPLMQNIYLSDVTKTNTFNESGDNLDNTKYSSIPKMSNICLAQKDKCENDEQKCAQSESIQTDLQQAKTGHKNFCNSKRPKINAHRDSSKEGMSQMHADFKVRDLEKVKGMSGSKKATILDSTHLNETTSLVDQLSFFNSVPCETEVTHSLYNKDGNGALCTKVKENEIIVLDSSSGDCTDVSDHDAEESDSDDPMEECLRIFNEFAESELQKEELPKQVPVEEHIEMDVSDSKTMDKISGQKKRIAHPAKCNVKSNREILVPFKVSAPHQIFNSRILQAQQQAVQITAAVKSGQAFVAATSMQHMSGFPATGPHYEPEIVCINLLDIQPAVSSGNHSYGVFQGHSIAAVTCRPNIPLRKTIQMPPPKVVTRRRPSVIPEIGSKVPHDTRQRYVNFFVEESLKTCSTVEEAFDKALSEEKAIYDRCGSKNMYLNIAVNTLKKLRDQGNLSSDYLQLAGRENNTRSRKQDEKNDVTGVIFYKLIKVYALSEEQLEENGYPRINPNKPGSAIICTGVTKNFLSDGLRRICCRCGETYSVTSKGKHVRKEECNYHSGRVLRHKVPGGVETRYSCCEAVVGTPGCQVAKLHVHDGQKENLDGFMKTFMKQLPSDGNPGVFAVDCEMCYTTQGLELTRVTVVDSSLQIVYDTFVKPANEIIDYNTRFSGVTEDDLKNITTSIRDVQAILLNMFSAESILIGHSLENDLYALKLIHDNVVDTSVVFPHRLGLPNKRALRNLIADYLRRIVQDDVGGHNCVEDARACMELMIWKVKEDTKGRR
uniref:RNA exonuclease 1 homolog isoform X2 n=1 Tax=Geotrypetes seraphini TaxID=260995 RepID=A0A6P8PL05_GEOSA|nr:RNA exonuclease 1 homolog isoform X2 [Geotrypetes seraphini]